MKKIKTLAILLPLILLSMALNINGFDGSGDRTDGHFHGGYHTHGHRYAYYSRDWWHPHWWWNGYYLYLPPAGTVVTLMPDDVRVIVINGQMYYTWGKIYFIKTVDGYESVSTPIIVPKTQTNAISHNQPVLTQSTNKQSSTKTLTVNVPDGKGHYIPIAIKQNGNGFTGPQGEYYPKFPKVSDLQVIYATNQ